MIRVEKENSVAWVIIDRQNALNALNTELLEELYSKLDQLNHDAQTRVLILTGAGERSFIAGADIDEWATKSALEIREFSFLGQKVACLLDDMKKPVLAAINGYALGGGLELALACDLRIACEHAKLGLPEAKLGVFPAWGGVPRIVRIAGLSAAKELLFTGSMVTAETAAKMKLIDHVVPAESLRRFTLDIAEAIAANAPMAIAFLKEIANQSLSLNRETGNLISADLFAICTQTADVKEGIAAFKERRSPIFNGK